MTSKVPIPPTPSAPTHATLIEALIAAQSEYPGIPKEATGQARGGRYQYATLPAVLEAVVPSLNRHGIALIQLTAIEGESLTLHTILRHTSGEEVSSVVPLPSPQSWQDWGSALTYARRYSITALAGVAPDVDDDGATAQGRPKPATVARPQPPADDLGWNSPAEAAARATATVQPPRAAPMPQENVMAPHGVCELHRVAFAQGQSGRIGHWRTENGRKVLCEGKPAAPSLAEQAAQIAAARGPAVTGEAQAEYREV